MGWTLYQDSVYSQCPFSAISPNNIFSITHCSYSSLARLAKSQGNCRELGNVESLARSLGNQALILAQQNHIREALTAAEKAYQLASGHGYTALAGQILPILERIRVSEEKEAYR